MSELSDKLDNLVTAVNTLTDLVTKIDAVIKAGGVPADQLAKIDGLITSVNAADTALAADLPAA